MSVTLAQKALLERLQDMPGRPAMAYPNGPSVTALPRIVAQNAPTAQRTSTLEGQTEGMAEIVVRVEGEAGGYDAEVNGIIESIVDHFPVGLRTDSVTIVEAPLPRPAIPGTAVYSVPVIIRGRFHF